MGNRRAAVCPEKAVTRNVLGEWQVHAFGWGEYIMTKQQVVAEYLAGRIDRREFVRRLTMAGVSATAAIAYAETLARPAAARTAGPNEKGFITAFQGTADYPITDTDGDGFTDVEEADCGSDPNDPTSTCGNTGGEFGAVEINSATTTDISFPLPGGGSITFGAGSTFTISAGTPVTGGLAMDVDFGGTSNGQPGSFLAKILLKSGSAFSMSGIRALASGTPVTLVVEEFGSWEMPGIPEPKTPFDVTVSGSGGLLTVEIDGAKTTISVTKGADGKLAIASLSGLPNTGAGSPLESASSGWLTPVVAVGAGLAVLSRRFRGRRPAS